MDGETTFRRLTRGIEHVDKSNCVAPSFDLGVSQIDSDNAGFTAELEEDKLRAETRRKSGNFVFDTSVPNILMQRYFDGEEEPYNATLFQAFEDKVWGQNDDNAFKISILYFVHRFIMSDDMHIVRVPRFHFDMISFRNIKASASEIASFQLPLKIVHNVTVVNSPMNDVVNSDNDFQDMPSISLDRKGKSNISISVSPSKKKQKQKQMSSGASISIKTPTKVVSNTAVSNTSPLLDNKTVKKTTLNKKLVEEQIQSPHNIEPPVTDAAVKRTIPIHDLNILNQKVNALEIYVKSEFQNLCNLINANHNTVMNAIKSKDIDEKSNMDVNRTPFYLYVPTVREHDANVNVQPEMDNDHEDVGIKDQSFDSMEVHVLLIELSL
ncbi:hypothetical protein FXO38_31541 [Capsicum annuum]|nr:hypothetical protein FXO38_31541 [Capsicum annuum]